MKGVMGCIDGRVTVVGVQVSLEGGAPGTSSA